MAATSPSPSPPPKPASTTTRTAGTSVGHRPTWLDQLPADLDHRAVLDAVSEPLAIADRHRWRGAVIDGPAGPLYWHPTLGYLSVPDPDSRAVSPPERAVVWLRLARGGRRAVEVGIDPAQVDQALAKWQRLLGPAGPLEVNLYPARADAGPPNPVFGLPDLAG